eukprot:Nk52_evm5s335 gene=Nk52_evmTU5s335
MSFQYATDAWSKAWELSSSVASKVWNPRASTIELAGKFTEGLKNSFMGFSDEDAGTVAKYILRPLEFISTTSNEARELSAMWVQFLLSALDVLKTDEAKASVEHTSAIIVQSLKVATSEQGTNLAQEISEVMLKVFDLMKSEEVMELLKLSTASVEKTVNVLKTEETYELAHQGKEFMRKAVKLLKTNPKHIAADIRAEMEEIDNWAQLVVVIGKLVDKGSLTEEESRPLIRLSRKSDKEIMILFSAFKLHQEEQKFVEDCRQLLDDYNLLM